MPANTATRPSVSHGSDGALATVARPVLPVAPYTYDRPYAITAEDTEPTRKNFSEASMASGARLAKPAST